MATATIEFAFTPGQSLTCDLYPRGSDTAAASGITLTERTNGKGIYRGTTTAALTGWHTARVKISTTVVAVYEILMSDTATDHYGGDLASDPEQRYGVHGAGQKVETDSLAANVITAASIAADAITAAKIADGAIDAATFAAGAITATVIATGAIDADAVAADAVTEIQSGLATASALSTVSGLVDDLESRLTAARAGYLDNINVGGAVASQADINALNQSASRRVLLVTVPQYERPESGTNSYTVEARTFDGDGVATNADSTPTLTATGIVSGSLAANLSAASNPATGVYRWTYSQVAAAALEQIRMDLSATIGGSAFTLSAYTQSADFIAATWTTTDAANLTAIYNKLPSRSYLAGATASTGAIVTADVGLAAANLDTQLGDLPTNAELATSQAAADDATLAAIAALNNISAAQVNAECDTAIADAALATAAALAAVQADLPARITKNVAYANFVFAMFSSTDHTTPTTGLTITAQRSIDGAAFANCANAASEISGGVYKINLAAADLNGDSVILKFSATGADTQFVTIATQPT